MTDTHMEALQARVRELETELADSDTTMQRMSALLTGVAAAIKGPPPPLTLHDWSDLPERAAEEMRRARVRERWTFRQMNRAVRERDALRGQLAEWQQHAIAMIRRAKERGLAGEQADEHLAVEQVISALDLLSSIVGLPALDQSTCAHEWKARCTTCGKTTDMPRQGVVPPDWHGPAEDF